MEVSLERSIGGVEGNVANFSGGVLLDLCLQDLNPLLEAWPESFRGLMDRHRVGGICHLNMEVASVNPHPVLQPLPRQTRVGVTLLVNQDKNLAGRRFHSKHEALVLSDLRGAVRKADK